jgi:hypothetical protein
MCGATAPLPLHTFILWCLGTGTALCLCLRVLLCYVFAEIYFSVSRKNSFCTLHQIASHSDNLHHIREGKIGFMSDRNF